MTMKSDQMGASDWMRQLLAELDCAGGLAVPLLPLLAVRLQGALRPQQLFDGIRSLLESGQMELTQSEQQAWMVQRGDVRGLPIRTGMASPGDLAELAAAIAQARGCRRAAPECLSADRAAVAGRDAPILRMSCGGHQGWGRDSLSIH